MAEMRAAVFRDGADDAVIEPVSITDLRDDEVLVRLVGVGVCHADLICRDGMAPIARPVVLGHEGAGHVERIGANVTSVAPGDAVVLTFLPCGVCANCAAGSSAYCHDYLACNFSGRRSDGSTGLTSDRGEISAHFFGQSSFATHSVANERNVIKVRDDAPLDLLGPLGCGIQTGAGTIFNVLKPGPGSSIAIFGAGGVGLSALLAAKVAGCDTIIVVEPIAARRAVAIDLGASYAIDPHAETDLVQTLRRLAGNTLNYALDTSGLPGMIEQGVAALFLRGKMAVITSAAKGSVMQIPISSLVIPGVTICGTNMGDSDPHHLIPMLVDLFMDGRFPIDKLVRHYAFEDINLALSDHEAGLTIKPIIRM